MPELAGNLIEFSSDPVTGAAYLDTIVPDLLELLKSDDSLDWQEEVISLYLYFGHLDRYFELIMATNPSDKTRHYAGIHAWRAVVMRKLGSTAHPEFRNLARMLSIDDVWEDRGAPDFCEKVTGDWVCS